MNKVHKIYLLQSSNLIFVTCFQMAPHLTHCVHTGLYNGWLRDHARQMFFNEGAATFVHGTHVRLVSVVRIARDSIVTNDLYHVF